MLPHPLTNFAIRKYYQNEPRFNGAYSRDNLQEKIKDGTYIINLDEQSDIVTYWTALYSLNNGVIYFDSFGLEHNSKEIKKFIGNKIIKTSIFRKKVYDSIMCGYFCIGFIGFMLAQILLIFFHQITLKEMMI